MTKNFNISGPGQVGIFNAEVDRSIDWYTEVLDLTLAGRWALGDR